MDLVLPWPEGKSMFQLDERGVMFSERELRQVVPELQKRIIVLEAEIIELRGDVGRLEHKAKKA